MEIKTREKQTKVVEFLAEEGGKQVGHARLFLIFNDFHVEPYGLLEYVFVEEEFRSKGLGGQLVEAVIEEAKKQKCYKLVATSRYGRDKIHDWYKKLGFEDRGKEFRMDFVGQ